jgi:hypothetical protein
LGFGEEDMDDEGFSPFLSRKTKKKMKYACKIQDLWRKTDREREIWEHR